MYLTGCSNFDSGNRAVKFLKDSGYTAKRDGSFLKDNLKAIIRPVFSNDHQVDGYMVFQLQADPVQPGQVEFKE